MKRRIKLVEAVRCGIIDGGVKVNEVNGFFIHIKTKLVYLVGRLTLEKP